MILEYQKINKEKHCPILDDCRSFIFPFFSSHLLYIVVRYVVRTYRLTPTHMT